VPFRLVISFYPYLQLTSGLVFEADLDNGYMKM
ncbi:MAG: hypothetical protein JWQ55_3661, partial [Rhodopila sp.]|nr:hypothetical protein [Rhodopila sp.]